jgi:hypothetical protein
MAVTEFTEISDPVYVRAQCVLQGVSGLPKDEIVNTFHFVADEGTGWEANIAGHLEDFYAAFGANLSAQVDRSGAVVKVYDASLAAPNPPLFTEAITIPTIAGSTIDLPGETALCCSFQAPIVSGLSQRRRRGRVYCGPLCTSIGDEMTPDGTILGLIVDAGESLIAATSYLDNAQLNWAVFSPTNAGGWYLPGGSGPPNMPASVSPVANGWVDNAWDTQRRRGLAPTARTTFTHTP